MESRHELGGGVRVFVTKEHRFGTDSFLLSAFAAPKPGTLACDLCGGCGIVAALWFRRPEAAPCRAVTVEIQPEAAALAERCIEESGLGGKLVSLCADIRSLPLRRGEYDVVSCNPPYYAAGHGIPSREDAALTARHETLCTLEDVCRAGAGLLRFGGRLCLCQRPQRLPDVLEAMRGSGVEPKRMRFVQQRPASAPWLVLVEGRRGSRPFLRVEPPLFMEDEAGAPSAALRQVYEGGAL